MRRFYKQVAVVAEPAGAAGFGVALDGRLVRTPKKAALAVDGATLAEAIAEEWRRQGDDIEPESMPLLRLANTAIDMVAGRRDAVVDDLASFGGTDLLCYRASEPDDLVRRQVEFWSPWLDWAASRHGANLVATKGITPIPQDPSTLAALRGAVDRHDVMELAALHDLITIPGSVVLGLAVSAGALEVPAAWAAARLEHEYQAERWGRDAEAEAQADRLRGEFEIAARFLELHRAR